MSNLHREVHWLSASPVAPLRTKDGKILLHDPNDILLRWRKHFDELLNRNSEVEEEFIRSTPEKHGGECLLCRFHLSLQYAWNNNSVPDGWKDSLMFGFYKVNGGKDEC